MQNIPAISKTGLILLAVLVWSCSDPLSLEEEGLTLTNRTTTTLVIKVFEQESSTVSPNPAKFLVRRPRSPWSPILQPDESVTISEKDIPNGGSDVLYDRFKPIEDVRIFLWEVVGDSAFTKGGITLTNEELKQQKFRVEIKF